jgi:predicted membrane-bound dolichyl-phosphate-mannose-protein mannosyltransferase
LYDGANPSTLFALDGTQPVLRQWDEDGNELREIRLPFLPDCVFSVEDNPHLVLAVHLGRGEVMGFNLHEHAMVWQKEFGHPLSDAAADTVYGICFLTVPDLQSVIALDFQGKVQGRWHVPFAPRSVVPVLTPSVVPRGGGMRPYLLCVLASSRKQVALLPTAGRPNLKVIHFPRPIRSIAGHVRAADLHLLSAGKITVIAPHTMEVTQTRTTDPSVQSLLLTTDSKLLVSRYPLRRQMVIHHLPNYVWATRLPTAVMGGFFLPLLGFWFAYRATRLLPLAASAALLIACDPLLWSLSRMAMLDLYVTTFVMAALLFGFEYLQAETARARTVLGVLTGVFFGFACACKWNAVPLWLGFGVLLCIVRRGHIANGNRRVNLKASPFLILLCFVVLPGLAYFVCYALAYAHGTSLSQVIRLQCDILRRHAAYAYSHPFASAWWQWPFSVNAAGLFHEHRGATGTWIYLCGAPWLWLPGLVCVALTAIRAWRTRELFPALIVIAFAFAWLPWIFSPRITFLYYFSTALPFLYMAVAHVIGNVRSGAWQVSARWREHILLLCDGYIVLAVLTFIWLYPTLTGYPLPSEAGHHYNAWWMGWLPALVLR